MGYPNWRTPHEKKGDIFFDLNEEFHFTLDAAASHANALLPRYCTEEGKFESNGRTYLQIAPHDGLAPEAWQDEVVFCNPPYYADTIKDWVNVANMRVAKTSVMLLPPSIDTAWFKLLWPDDARSATVRHGDNYEGLIFYSKSIRELKPEREIRFMHGRVKFLRPARERAIYGEDDEIIDYEPDETDPNSIAGPAPRAGNLVVVTYG